MPRASKPHERTKARRRELSPDEQWAEQIAKLALDSCHDFQRDAVEDPARFFTWLVGRGGGKTTAYKVKFTIGLARIVGGRFVYIAPTLGMATDLLWDPLKDLLDRIAQRVGLQLQDLADMKEQAKTCTLRRTGARLKLIGADDRREIDKLRGQPFDGVGIDEAALFPVEHLNNLVYRAIGPRLGERAGWLGLAGTPGHILQGLFFEASCPWYRRRDGSVIHRPYADRNKPEFAGWKLWSSHHWSLKQVAELPDAAKKYPAIVANYLDGVERQKAENVSDDNPVHMRERLGLWAQDDTENIYKYRAHVEGRDWNQWDPPLDPVTGFAVLPAEFSDWLFGYGNDMGSKDPYALNIFALSPTDPSRTLYHVYCFGKTEMSAHSIAMVMIGEEARDRVMRGENIDYATTGAGTFAVTGWPAANVADFAGLGEAIARDLAQVYGIRIKAAEKKGKHGEIAATNGDLIDGKIKILKGSELETQLTSLQWRRDEYGLVKEGKGDRNDHTDSMIYIRREMVGLFASGLAVPPENKKQLYAEPAGLVESPDVGEYDALLSEPEFEQDWGND